MTVLPLCNTSSLIHLSQNIFFHYSGLITVNQYLTRSSAQKYSSNFFYTYNCACAKYTCPWSDHLYLNTENEQYYPSFWDLSPYPKQTLLSLWVPSLFLEWPQKLTMVSTVYLISSHVRQLICMLTKNFWNHIWSTV